MLHTKIKEREAKLLEEFKCINPDCDGAGNIPRQVAEDEWEAEQCQFCFERRFPLKAFNRTYSIELLQAVIEMIEGRKIEYENADNYRRGATQALTDLQSLLLDEINKIKE